MRCKLLAVVIGLVCLFSIPGNCCAEEKKTGEWEFELTPYAWFINISGKTSVRGSSGDTSLNYGDISKLLEKNLAINHEGRTNDYGYILDISYLGLKDDEDTPIGNVEYKSEQTTLEAVGFYSQELSAASRLDYLGGIRYTDQKITLSRSNSFSREIDWIDPNCRIALGPRFE